MGSNAAVAEMPGKTLYDVEDDLLALLDSEEGVPPEMEEQFRIDLAAALTGAKDKRERVARKILQLEAEVAYARGEAQRVQAWARVREMQAARLRGYVLRIIESLPKDAKGKPAKLEGLTTTMSARACPVSLDITDAAAVPKQYKDVSVVMSADLFESWAFDKCACSNYEPRDAGCPVCGGTGLLPNDKYTASKGGSWSIDRPRLKVAIEGGADVPGADLIIGKNSLVVK